MSIKYFDDPFGIDNKGYYLHSFIDYTDGSLKRISITDGKIDNLGYLHATLSISPKSKPNEGFCLKKIQIEFPINEQKGTSQIDIPRDLFEDNDEYNLIFKLLDDFIERIIKGKE